MPAKSKSQQRLFGMVHAYKKGELDSSSVNSALLKKIKKIAGGIKDKSAKKFAKTKHKGLPELKEAEKILCPKCKKRTVEKGPRNRTTGLPKLECQNKKCRHVLGTTKVTYSEKAKITFKEYLVEQFTEKQRQILTPPVVVQKIYGEIKRKYGVVKREDFYSKLADRLSLTPRGLCRLQQLPALRALPFDDESQDEKPLVSRRDPWGHVTQKSSQREQRARKVGI